MKTELEQALSNSKQEEFDELAQKQKEEALRKIQFIDTMFKLVSLDAEFEGELQNELKGLTLEKLRSQLFISNLEFMQVLKNAEPDDLKQIIAVLQSVTESIKTRTMNGGIKS